MIPVSGIAAIAKPAGVTSFVALSPLKRKAASGRVGHAGTLDKFATGLLIALLGSSSRLASVFSGLDKRYRAVVRFGAETATLDPEGEVVAEAPCPDLASIEAVLPGFRGRIMQKPPAYSALHIDGKRAYERALRGEVIDMVARPVTIHGLVLESWNGQDGVFDVSCSSGTYIRSLARDIAVAAGSRASLVALERSSIGPIGLSQAVSPSDFDPDRDLFRLDRGLAQRLGLGSCEVPARLEALFRNGGKLRQEDFQVFIPGGEGAATAIFGDDGVFLGLVDFGEAGIHYRFVVGDAR